MATTLNQDNSITVTAYSLPEFTFEIAYLGAKGFTPSMLNSHCPTGGMGSIYQAILVPLTSHYISFDGTHVNVPETPTEAPVNEATSSVVSAKATTTEQPVKQATTRAKKTT